MNKQQYGLAVIMLASMGQIPDAFAQLDNAELENLIFLLQGALLAATSAYKHRPEEGEE